MPDLAKTVKVESDHSENLSKVFDGDKNGNFNYKFPNVFFKCLKIAYFNLIFIEESGLYGA